MSLIRLLLFIAAIWLIMRFLKTWNVRIERREPPPSAGAPPEREPLTLRSCAGCGVRVPVGELDGSERCQRCRAAPPPK
jgi:hypothetical protein